MSASTPSEQDELVIEAPSAERALAEVTSRLGPDARISSAQKVLRGGVGGFFAKELVQIRATRREGGEQPLALDEVLARISEDASAQDQTFSEVLRSHLAAGDAVPPEPDPEPAAAPAPSAEPRSRPVPKPQPPFPIAGPSPAWSVENLLRLGMPRLVTDAVAHLRPEDDLPWAHRIADVVARLCGPLPEGPAILAGPRSHRLAAALGVPVREPGHLVPPEGDVAVVIHDDPAERAWLGSVRAGRWLHLVAGGRCRGLLFDHPSVVSWAGDANLPEALRACADLGLTLGYGVTGGRRARARRAQPSEIALAVRALLPLR